MERRSGELRDQVDPGGDRPDADAAQAGKADPDLDRRHLGTGVEAGIAARRVARFARDPRAGGADRTAHGRGRAGSGFRDLAARRLGRQGRRSAERAARGFSRGWNRPCDGRAVRPRARRLAALGRAHRPRRRGGTRMRLATTLKFSPNGGGIGMDIVWEAERLGFDAVSAGETYGTDAVTPVTWVLAPPPRNKSRTPIPH